MIQISTEQMLKITGGQVINVEKLPPFKHIEIDSRQVNTEDYFMPILGEVHDGHKFIIGALEKAPLSFCERAYFYSHYDLLKDCPLILVDNTTDVLHRLTQYIIDITGVKVIGITGSVGKTSTKEFIYHALKKHYKVHKNKGNFNNHIGLPLTVFDLEMDHEVAILEMGMNHFKEIETLVKMANPDIAVITNIGTSHIGILGSRENIFQAKMEITSYLKGCLIINGADDFLKTVESQEFKVLKTGKDLQYSHVDQGLNGCYSYEYNHKNVQLGVLGKHNISNSLLAIGVGQELKVPLEDIIEGIESFTSNDKRLEVIEGKACRIINDCYNASQESMISAIEVLNNFEGKRVAILGDVLELGDFALESHTAVGMYLKDHPVDCLLTYGDHSQVILKASGLKGQHFKEQKLLIDYVKGILENNTICLVKGSLGMQMKNIVEELR